VGFIITVALPSEQPPSHLNYCTTIHSSISQSVQPHRSSFSRGPRSSLLSSSLFLFIDSWLVRSLRCLSGWALEMGTAWDERLRWDEKHRMAIVSHIYVYY
jgi:hypothetical protein